MRLRIGVLALLVVILGCGLGSAQTKSVTPKAAGKTGARRYINPPGAPSGLPFSEGVLVGDTLYVAGHIGVDPKTGTAPASVDEEIKLLLDGFKADVERAGMTMDNLVYVQVYCTDLSLYDKFNAAYKAEFKGGFPARAFIGAGSLLRNGHFEMLGIARK